MPLDTLEGTSEAMMRQSVFALAGGGVSTPTEDSGWASSIRPMREQCRVTLVEDTFGAMMTQSVLTLAGGGVSTPAEDTTAARRGRACRGQAERPLRDRRERGSAPP